MTDAIEQAVILLTSFLLDNAGDENWEEAFPEIDEARTLLQEALEKR